MDAMRSIDQGWNVTSFKTTQAFALKVKPASGRLCQRGTGPSMPAVTGCRYQRQKRAGRLIVYAVAGGLLTRANTVWYAVDGSV